MPLAIFLPFAIVLMAYYAYYWTGLTAVMLEDARYNRVKRDIDWTPGRSRSGRRKSGLVRR